MNSKLVRSSCYCHDVVVSSGSITEVVAPRAVARVDEPRTTHLMLRLGVSSLW
jgi:hypothetical protein